MPTARRLQPRKQPKQARAVETRDRILAAAARVFARHGYAAGTTNRIAEAAGLSVGSLYQYFPNKDAILLELVTAHLNEGVAAVQALLAAEGGLPPGLDDKLRLFVHAAVSNHLGQPALHRVLFEEAPRPRQLLKQFRAAEAWVVAAAAALLADDPEVRVPDTDMAARLVVTAIESLVHRYFAWGPPDDVDRFEDEVVAMLARYLRA
jgi:AcrR family transcriptional regulator